MKTDKWFLLRRDLYRYLETQVRHRLGREPKDLLNYRLRYEREFSRTWKVSQRDHLIHELGQARLILMGDFHALHQSQKAQLRILKHLQKEKKPMVLALECFEAKNQAILDKYCAGKLTEREFLKAIQWQQSWGFPYEHYRPLIKYAIRHKWRLVALNLITPRRTGASLLVRDRFAASIIAQELEKSPQVTVFTIYGDMHLATPHLMEALRKKVGAVVADSVVRIFQNSEALYFRQLKKDPAFSADVMRSGRRDFCLLNVPPWVKWQNYLMFIEENYDKDLGEGLDFTDHVVRYVKLIASDLGLEVRTDALSVYTSEDASFWNLLEQKFNKKQLLIFERKVEEGMSFYIPELGYGYLARPSVNHAASLAMNYIHAQLCHRQHTFFDVPSDFSKLIWIEGLAYFGSKLVNPKRKTDTLTDMKAALASRGSKDNGREAMTLALSQKMSELMIISGRERGVPLTAVRSKWSYWLAAEYLGGLLGERLYEGYRKKMISSRVVKDFLVKQLDSPSFMLAYYEILEVVESLPLAFKSKKERL